MENATKKLMPTRVIALIAVVFGVMTVFSGGRALFGDAQAQAAVGNAVAFVLWFNFVAGFFYVACGAAIGWGWAWARSLALGLALATAAVALAFGVHVLQGGAFEMRTVGALVLRLGFWAGVAWWVRRA
jgi:hypothetical protein